MGVFVTVAGPSPLSQLTFGRAKERVAAVATQGLPTAVDADDAIRLVLEGLNAYRWDFLAINGSDIALVDAAGLVAGNEGFKGRYTFPFNITDLISAKARFTGTEGGVRLQVISRQYWDRLVETDIGLGARYITWHNQGTTGQVEILDPPSQAGTLEVRLWRKIVIPVQDTDTLDVPADGPLQGYVIARGKEYVAVDKGYARKAAHWHRVANKLEGQALGSDRLLSMWDEDWQPRHEREQQFPARQKRFEPYGTHRIER